MCYDSFIVSRQSAMFLLCTSTMQMYKCTNSKTETKHSLILVTCINLYTFTTELTLLDLSIQPNDSCMFLSAKKEACKHRIYTFKMSSDIILRSFKSTNISVQCFRGLYKIQIFVFALKHDIMILRINTKKL